MSASTMERAGVLTGRQMMLFVVAGLHMLVIGVLMKMQFDIDRPATPAFKAITQERITIVDTPPPQKPVLDVEEFVPRSFMPDVPLPDVRPAPNDLVPIDTGPRLPALPESAGPTSGDSFVIPPTELSSRVIRSPDDYYPSASITMQEEGAAIVRVCVGPTGRIEGTPSVQRSSGSRRLDAAAVKWAGEGMVFTPATRNGAAVPDCKDFRVVFNLR